MNEIEETYISNMDNASGLGKLGVSDWKAQIVNAVFSAVLVTLAGVAGTPNFDVFHADWATIGKMVVNAVVIVVTTSLSKRLLTDENGTVHLGVAQIEK